MECTYCHRTFVGSQCIIRLGYRLPCCDTCLSDIINMDLAFRGERSIAKGAAHARKFLSRVQGKGPLTSLFAKCPECKSIASWTYKDRRLGFHYWSNGNICHNSGAFQKKPVN